MLTFEAADDVEVDPFELEEVVELADEWLSELLILLRNLSNSEIFLSEMEEIMLELIQVKMILHKPWSYCF